MWNMFESKTSQFEIVVKLFACFDRHLKVNEIFKL